MFLAQSTRLPGIHVAGIVDLNPAGAISNLAYIGWPTSAYETKSLDNAIKTGTSFVGDDWQALASHPAIDLIIECTGDPVAAVHHILTAFDHKKHVINATVEADAFCGRGISKSAEEANVIYSMAYGDQPALACELVDWARTCGLSVVAAGRGHKWLPRYRFSTPETIWSHWGLTAKQAERGRLIQKCSIALDGSKPAIELQLLPMQLAFVCLKMGLHTHLAALMTYPTYAAEISRRHSRKTGLVEDFVPHCWD